jgi:hypothetical protein
LLGGAATFSDGSVVVGEFKRHGPVQRSCERSD